MIWVIFMTRNNIHRGKSTKDVDNMTTRMMNIIEHDNKEINKIIKIQTDQEQKLRRILHNPSAHKHEIEMIKKDLITAHILNQQGDIWE